MSAVVSYEVVVTDRDQSLIGSIEHLPVVASVFDIPTWNFDAATVYSADYLSSQTTFVSEHRSFSISQDAVLPADLLQWQEFIRSSARGAEFQVHPEAIPPFDLFDKAYNCKLDMSSFPMSNFAWNVYTGGFDAIIMSEFDRAPLPTFLRSGDRSSLMKVSMSAGLPSYPGTVPNNVVNGLNAGDVNSAWAIEFPGTVPVTGQWIEFTFPYPVRIAQIINIGPGGGIGGTWRAEHHNGTNWVSAAAQTLQADQVFPTGFGGLATRYRLFGTSGTTTNAWLSEIEFA